MKKMLCLLVLVACFKITFAQSDKQAIIKVLDEQRIAWNNGDIPQ